MLPHFYHLPFFHTYALRPPVGTCSFHCPAQELKAQVLLHRNQNADLDMND